MKNRFLAIYMILAVTLCMMPGVAFAAKENTAFIASGIAAKKSVKYSWSSVEGAAKYKVYQARCGKKYKKIKTTTQLSYTKKKLKSKSTYKAYVVACNGEGAVIAKTPAIHIMTKYGNKANAKAVSAKATISLKTGKTDNIGAVIASKDSKKKLLWKNHVGAQIRYYSADPAVASVDANGNVTGNSEGKAYIYSVAPSGVHAITEVTVAKPVRTSTTSVLGYDSFASLKAADPYISEITSSKGNKFKTFAKDGFPIPGLILTNMGNDESCDNMVPQGITFAEDYLLLSSYCASNSCKTKKCGYRHHSVIYVLDRNSYKYLCTIVLEGDTGHVGGLAYNYDAKEVYFAHSSQTKEGKPKEGNCVKRIPMSDIQAAVRSGEDCVKITPSGMISIDDTIVSYIFYKDNRLYVGQFNAKGKDTNFVTSYYVSSQKAVKDDQIILPKYTQGAVICSRNGKDYMLVSASYGRKNNGKLYLFDVTKITQSGDEHIIISGVTCKDYLFTGGCEDVDIHNGDLYVNIEKAGAVYREGRDNEEGIISINPVDYVPISDCLGEAGLLEALIQYNKNNISAEEAVSVKPSEGACGDNIWYDIDSQGNLNISGYGDMWNFDGNAPWAGQIQDIRHVYIGSEVTSVGNNAFAGAENLETVKVSDLSDFEKEFRIGDLAFADCINLSTVELPDKDYMISTSAFEGAQEGLTIMSNSSDVAQYCIDGITLHNHSFVFSKTVDPTDMTAGYDEYACDCGAVEHRNFQQTIIQ